LIDQLLQLVTPTYQVDIQKGQTHKMPQKAIFWIWVLILARGIESLELCSKPVEKPQICAVYENHTSNKPPSPLPLVLQPVMDFRDIIDFDLNTNTITIFVRILIFWNDTSIKLTGPDPE